VLTDLSRRSLCPVPPAGSELFPGARREDCRGKDSCIFYPIDIHKFVDLPSHPIEIGKANPAPNIFKKTPNPSDTLL
jgi:hypothetical protein